MVFQQSRWLDWRSVQTNVDLVAKAVGCGPGRTLVALLRAVGLSDDAGACPSVLSGGQRQRVALACAFAIEPEVRLLERSCCALDELTARRLRILLQEVWREICSTDLHVAHNIVEATFPADLVVVLGGNPARIVDGIAVDLTRPRHPEDPALFELQRKIIRLLNGA